PYLFNQSRYDSVHDVAWARHCKLAEACVAEQFPHSIGDPEVEHHSRRQFPPRAGRFLVWYRDLTVDDGVGAIVTNGYLDESDMPPWDTWICYVDQTTDAKAAAGYLLSWVPSEFVTSVQNAITSNAYDALVWLRGSRLVMEDVLLDEQLLE